MKRIKVACDANIPERAVRMLAAGFQEDGFEFIWEPEFAAANAEDEFWASSFQKFGGSVVLTGDKNIAKRPHQIAAFKQCGLICFFLGSRWAQQDLTFKAAHLIKWWPAIQAELVSANPCDCWCLPVSMRGILKPMDDAHLSNVGIRAPRK